MSIRPISFNTDAVRAILDGQKTCFRRVVSGAGSELNFLYLSDDIWVETEDRYGEIHEKRLDGLWATFDGWTENGVKTLFKAPFMLDEELWVRESWAPIYPNDTSTEIVGYMYKADDTWTQDDYDCKHPDGKAWTWPGRRSSKASMPKEAARIFLSVTDIYVERLQDITEEDAIAEGIRIGHDGAPYFSCRDAFRETWDSTLKPKARASACWDANPWVFVISFERCERPKRFLNMKKQNDLEGNGHEDHILP